MSNFMYAATVPPIIRSLTNLRSILEKAVAYAEAKKIDPFVLINVRIYPDMFPLSPQVQIATDVAKGAVLRLLVWSHQSTKTMNRPSLNS